MKKLILLSALVIISNVSFSQIYLGLNTQYAIQNNGQSLTELGLYNYSASVNSTSLEQKLTSFGGGFFGGLTVGYKFSNVVRAEINGGYHSSNKVKVLDSYPVGKYDYEFSSTAISIRPSLIFTISEGQKATFYSKLGAVYTVANMELSKIGELGGQRLSTLLEFDGGNGLGFQTGCGVSWALSDKLELITELNLINLSVSPKIAKYTKYEEGGIDLLGGMPTSDKEFEFKETVVTTSSASNSSRPTQNLRTKVPYNGVGLNVGIRFELGNKSIKGNK